MTQFAILDSATRIIKRLTTDNPPQIVIGEIAIDTSANPIILNGFQKLDLDNRTLLKPTQLEIDTAEVDETRNTILAQQKKQVLKSAIDAILTDLTIPQKFKDYFQALKNLQ